MTSFAYIMSFIILFLGVFYIGIVAGIQDCKRTFCIPKGVKNVKELEEYKSAFTEDFINE